MVDCQPAEKLWRERWRKAGSYDGAMPVPVRIAIIAALPREIAGLIRGAAADAALIKDGGGVFRLGGGAWGWGRRCRGGRWGCWFQRGWREDVRRGLRLGR